MLSKQSIKHLHSEWIRKHTCLQRWIVRHVFNAAVPETKITFLVQREFLQMQLELKQPLIALPLVSDVVFARIFIPGMFWSVFTQNLYIPAGKLGQECWDYVTIISIIIQGSWARQVSERLTSRPEWARPPGLQNQGRTNWVPAGSFASTERSVRAGECSLSPRAGASWGPACGSKAEVKLSRHHSCWMDPSCAFLRLTLLHWNNRRSSGWTRQRQGPTPQTPPGQTFPAVPNWRFGKHKPTPFIILVC